ncbi:MAG TPA: phosphatase PAP2 family protein [Spirochaetia bacterium]|nr:phosphatase PAP2 family protein [Spirochaetia bacterium]
MNISSRWTKKLLPYLFLVGISVGSVWPQSTPPAALVTYPVGDSLAFVGSGGLVGVSYLLEAHKPKPSLSDLSLANIPPFDRLYSTHKSKPLSLVSDATLAGTVLLPVFMIPSMSRDEVVSGGVVYAEALALSYGLKSLIKGLVVRYRPYAYSATSDAQLLADPEILDSFPSGHVTVAFAAAVATGYIFDLYSTSPGERAAVWSASLGLATATAVLRVWSGNHFVSDVVGAAFVGTLVGVLVPFIHSPSSMSAAGIPLSLKTELPPEGIPILQWHMSLP